MRSSTNGPWDDLRRGCSEPPPHFCRSAQSRARCFGVVGPNRTRPLEGRDEVDRIAGAIRATHPDFRSRPRPNRRSCITPVASDGYRAAPATHRPMPEPTSSSLAMAGLPPFTSSWTPSSHDDVRRGRIRVLHGCGSRPVAGKFRSTPTPPWLTLSTDRSQVSAAMLPARARCQKCQKGAAALSAEGFPHFRKPPAKPRS